MHSMWYRTQSLSGDAVLAIPVYYIFGSHIMKFKDLLILLTLHYFLNVAEPTLQPQY